MVRLRMTRRTLSYLLVVVGFSLLSLAGLIIAVPLGLAIAGAATTWAGLYLVDVGGLIEPRTAPPKRVPPV